MYVCMYVCTLSMVKVVCAQKWRRLLSRWLVSGSAEGPAPRYATDNSVETKRSITRILLLFVVVIMIMITIIMIFMIVIIILLFFLL